MARYKTLLAFLLIVLLICACDVNDRTAISDEPKNQTLAIASPPAELKTPQKIRIYRFLDDKQVYETEETAFSDKGMLLSVIDHITGAMGLTEPLPILSVTQQKGFVVINFEKGILERFGQNELRTILTTLVMTLQQNVLSVETVQFQLDGEIGAFGETYEPARLAFVPGDSTEFAEILATIPYEGIKWQDNKFLIEPIDETAKEITEFLSVLGQIEKDADSPAELDAEHLFMSCVWATPYYVSAPYDYAELYYRPQLAPIADSVSAKLQMPEDMFWIADHIQQTAKQLCGEEFTLPLSQESCTPWQYFPQEGVITPPHMGGGYEVLPTVLNYEATAEGYRIEAVYIYESVNGFALWGGEALPEAQLEDFIQNKAPRREIILHRTENGGLRFVSHHFI